MTSTVQGRSLLDFGADVARHILQALRVMP